MRPAGIGAIAHRCTALRGWSRAGPALAAGAVSVLAMAPFFFTFVLFATLPVLIWLIDGAAAEHDAASSGGPGARTRFGWTSAAAVGWWFGFGYFLAGLFWIGDAFLVEAEKFAWALPFAITLLPAGLALFYGLAVGAAASIWRPGMARVLALALALAAAEWLRGHVLSGFPWNLLGYALTYPLPLMQSAGVMGVHGLTLLAVPVFASPLVAWADWDPGWRRTVGLWVAAIPLALAWLYGTAILAHPEPASVAGVRLRLVQPSVPQREKWKPENQRVIFQDHLDLSARASDGTRDDLAGATHVIWPEAAMPFLPLGNREAIAAIGDLLPAGVHLLAGALRIEDAANARATGTRRVFNSLLVFAPNGELAALYDKIHLVPFGEYLPLQGLLESIGLEQLTRLRGGFAAGPSPRPLLGVSGLPPVGALICYEAIFPAAIVQGTERPGVLVNVTNDGWFGNTTGPHQHFHQARVRAVEEGLPLVRAANNGISAVIDGRGRVLARLELNQRGVIDSALPAPAAAPPYARFGDAVFFCSWLALLALLALALRLGSNRHPRARASAGAY